MSTSKPGYTLIELLIAMLVSSILIGITTSTFTLFRKSITQDQTQVDLTQNARISEERIARELRQTREVITVLPTSSADTTVTEPHLIEFENGHAEVGDSDYLYYYKYYLSGTTLELDTKKYTVSPSTTAVKWNTAGATATVLSTVTVAESVSDISFYAPTTSSTQFTVTTSDGANKTYALRTTILKRN